MDAAYFVRRRRERRFSPRVLLNDIPDDVFISRYRLSKESVREIVDLLRHHLEPLTVRGRAITVETKVLISLRFLAKGNIYSELADLHGISRSSVSRILHAFVSSVNKRMMNIRFPVDVQDQTCVKVGFFRLCGLPQVLGAVDGTLIPIIAPKEHEEAFVCRKGFHALNVQAIVDSELRFLNVVSTYPGSTHDAFMFEGCGVKDYMERNDVGYLLGDSGYTLRRYCMTPLANPNSVQQTRFNIAHKRGRVVVERAFGVLKSRFRCLHKTGGCLPFTPSKCAQIVLACMHLHNFCMDRNIMDPTLMPDVDDDDEDDAIDRQADGVDGTDRRNVIIGRM